MQREFTTELTLPIRPYDSECVVSYEIVAKVNGCEAQEDGEIYDVIDGVDDEQFEALEKQAIEEHRKEIEREASRFATMKCHMDDIDSLTDCIEADWTLNGFDEIDYESLGTQGQLIYDLMQRCEDMKHDLNQLKLCGKDCVK